VGRERERAEAETEGIEYRLRRSPADRLVVAVKLLLAGVGVERRGRLIGDVHFDQPGPRPGEEAKLNMPTTQDKPFRVPKLMVWEAWRQVKANEGAPGADGQALDEFEADLENNLYKIWNRMSSGTWFPPPVRAVEIPKPHGDGVRVLGVPTIADRVAQTVVAMYLEPLVEPRFHPDSYGYRPGKSAHDALATCRERCWKYDWIIDLDVQKFFDEVPWDLIVRSVEAVTDCRWVLLYVKRWLAAPLQRPDGTLQERNKGTPQGSAVSPVLANLFMHYAFDAWMAREFPGCPFERYADDGVVHCKSRRQAECVLAAIAARMNEVGLRLHPQKTRIVYCKDSNRRAEHEHTTFTFLGFMFRPRTARNSRDGTHFTSFLPAMSPEALNAKSRRLRELRIHRRTNLSLDDLARWLNPIIVGWMNYYGRYYRTVMDPLLRRVNTYLRRWAGNKYRRRLRSYRRFWRWWNGLLEREPDLFAHWKWVRATADLRTG
jgi:RNA-directed DNA polymerase